MPCSFLTSSIVPIYFRKKPRLQPSIQGPPALNLNHLFSLISCFKQLCVHFLNKQFRLIELHIQLSKEVQERKNFGSFQGNKCLQRLRVVLRSVSRRTQAVRRMGQRGQWRPVFLPACVLLLTLLWSSSFLSRFPGRWQYSKQCIYCVPVLCLTFKAIHYLIQSSWHCWQLGGICIFRCR